MAASTPVALAGSSIVIVTTFGVVLAGNCIVEVGEENIEDRLDVPLVVVVLVVEGAGDEDDVLVVMTAPLASALTSAPKFGATVLSRTLEVYVVVATEEVVVLEPASSDGDVVGGSVSMLDVVVGVPVTSTVSGTSSADVAPTSVVEAVQLHRKYCGPHTSARIYSVEAESCTVNWSGVSYFPSTTKANCVDVVFFAS